MEQLNGQDMGSLEAEKWEVWMEEEKEMVEEVWTEKRTRTNNEFYLVPV